MLQAHWMRDMKGVYDVPVQVTALDEPGVLARITKEIGDRKANISSISTRPMGDGRSTVRLVLQVEDQSRLDTILKALRRAKGVVGVERLRHAPASGGS